MISLSLPWIWADLLSCWRMDCDQNNTQISKVDKNLAAFEWVLRETFFQLDLIDICKILHPTTAPTCFLRLHGMWSQTHKDKYRMISTMWGRLRPEKLPWIPVAIQEVAWAAVQGPCGAQWPSNIAVLPAISQHHLNTVNEPSWIPESSH